MTFKKYKRWISAGYLLYSDYYEYNWKDSKLATLNRGHEMDR